MSSDEPCDNCPFRLQGINTPPETAKHLIDLALNLGEREHPCHATVMTDHPSPCRGAVQFRQNVTAGTCHDGIFTNAESMIAGKTLGVEGEK